ncbi:MAG: hypothetical protein ACQET8_16450 [Bacillota bacterium]
MTEDQLHSKNQNRADSMHQMCKQHMYYHVTIKTRDGQEIEGIITDLDKKNVYMMVPQNMMPVEEEQESPQPTQQSPNPQQQSQQVQQSSEQNQRQWYGNPYYRRYYRQIFPLASLAALSLYPYYPPYPYPYYLPYPYPYY